MSIDIVNVLVQLEPLLSEQVWVRFCSDNKVHNIREELQYTILGNYKHRRREMVHKIEYSDNRRSENTCFTIQKILQGQLP